MNPQRPVSKGALAGPLARHVVLVTAGRRDIGPAIAPELVARGADVGSARAGAWSTSRWKTVSRVRSQYLSPERPPASTMIGVTALVYPELLIEIETYALVKD